MMYQEIALGRVVSFLYPHRQENLCIMVPRNLHSSQMSLPSFSVYMWVLTAVVLLLFWLVLMFAYRAPAQRASLDVMRTFITGAFATAQRRLMVWLSAFSFVVMNAFSGSLVGSLVAPGQQTQVNTLAQVNALYDVVYSTKVTAEAIANIGREDDPAAYALARKVRSIGQGEWRQVISAAASGSAPAAVLSTETGLDIFRSYPDASARGVPLFHKGRRALRAAPARAAARAASTAAAAGAAAGRAAPARGWRSCRRPPSPPPAPTWPTSASATPSACGAWRATGAAGAAAAPAAARAAAAARGPAPARGHTSERTRGFGFRVVIDTPLRNLDQCVRVRR